MTATISDGDIAAYLRRNAGEYPSQMSLIQATVRILWPEGPPEGAPERVVRICLGISPSRVAAATWLPVSSSPPV